MYFKIAITNIKKNYKDYEVYFLTVVLAICIFYAFNSLDSQKSFMDLSESQEHQIDFILEGINILSIIILVVLACLILYANYNIVKKRKKEYGICNMLGMGKVKIAAILTLEVFIVCVISLIIGLVLGIILSQVLFFITVNFFLIKMYNYMLIISLFSIVKTVFSFAIIFIISLLINYAVIFKLKAIDSMSNYLNNKKDKKINTVIYIVSLILSIVVILISYHLAFNLGVFSCFEKKFIASIVLGIIGTVLLFYGLSGVCVFVLTKNKRMCLKDLNIIVYREISNKINVNFFSMALVCIMLFFSMIILSTSLNLKNAIESGIKKTVPFDVSETFYGNKFFSNPNNQNKNYIEKLLNDSKINFDKSDKHVFFNEYFIKDFNLLKLKDAMSYREKSNIFMHNNNDAHFVKLSDYNKIRNLKGQKPIKLQDDEVVFISNVKGAQKIIYSYLNSSIGTCTIKGKIYRVYRCKAIDDILKNSTEPDNLFTIVMKDDEIKNFDKFQSSLVVKCTGDVERSSYKFNKFFNKDVSRYLKDRYTSISASKDYVYKTDRGLKFSILYIALFIGIIFIIASMSILSLKQLTDANNSIGVYNVLTKLGVGRELRNKIIFKQIFVYFAFPFVIAFVYTVSATFVVNDVVEFFNQPNIIRSSLMTLIIFIIFYIMYFYATYVGYKRMVDNYQC